MYYDNPSEDIIYPIDKNFMNQVCKMKKEKNEGKIELCVNTTVFSFVVEFKQ